MVIVDTYRNVYKQNDIWNLPKPCMGYRESKGYTK